MMVANIEHFKLNSFSGKLSVLAKSETAISLGEVESSVQYLEQMSNMLMKKSETLLGTSQLTHVRTALIYAEMAILYFPANRQAYKQLILIASLLGYKKQASAATDVVSSGLILVLENVISSILNCKIGSSEDEDVLSLKLRIASQTANVVDELLNLTAHTVSSVYTKYEAEIPPATPRINPLTLQGTNASAFERTNDVTRYNEAVKHFYPYTQIERWASHSGATTFQFAQQEWAFNVNEFSLPSHFSRVISDIKKTSLRPIVLAHNTDVSIYSYTQGNDSEIYFPISRCGKIYLSRHSLEEPDYMYSYQLFEESRKKGGMYSINFDRYHQKYFELSDPVFLLGGSKNFGHWLVDYVGRLVALYTLGEQKFGLNLDKVPLICPNLHGWQAELLELMGITNPIIQTSVTHGHLWHIKCKSLFLVGNLSLPTKFNFLRDRIRIGMKGRSRLVKESKSMIYLSRAKWDNRTGSYRVKNHTEIDQLFRSEGFSVVHAEDESMVDLADMLYGAKVIASDFSSNMFNFFLFSNEESIHINLIASRAYHEDLGLNKGFSFHLPFFHRTIFVYGEQVCRQMPLEISSINYDPSAVINAIRTAKVSVQ